ncbi:DUF2075 domain-containing protein [Chitinibacter sp. GC72]|uniref:DUF2075 domain-containing protein n=1 Tax=Chitinibacter sp. GC72 TaxID=1526917 RepID=UPI0012FA3E73|nr:DUF2075 domain-containing protein [Chitinibacter sp. GC72]
MFENAAFYGAPVDQFLHHTAEHVIGVLTQRHSQNLEHLQTGAWRMQVLILQQALAEYADGYVLLEAKIPRMGRRADAVLILRNRLFVIEFKIGSSHYLAPDLRQVHGYALDLHHFHSSSHEQTIVPILVASEGPATDFTFLSSEHDSVYQPVCANSTNLPDCLARALVETKAKQEITWVDWLAGSYKPTPTIIQAAQALYADHEVLDIARHDAGAKNLYATTHALQDIIHQSREQKNKAICFVTGVPGAGKTLVGLNIATNNANPADDEHAVFLSGNGPLVAVLTEALARDSILRQQDGNKRDALRKAESHIQNIHRFRDQYLEDHSAPAERVVIFDEAQRAWNLEHTAKFMNQKRGQQGFKQSEPEFLISVMDRHQDWCVIIALIGGGQEINQGEAGLQGWLDALCKHFSHWNVYYSPQLAHAEYAGGGISLAGVHKISESPALHLATSMRSFRAETLSHWVHHLIHNDVARANWHAEQLQQRFPIMLTRELEHAKQWIRQQARGEDSKGLIASSGAIRLKPEGIFVKNTIDATDWFLNDVEDVRSSHYLEDVATEFDIQGLELDWCLVAWDADYRYQEGQFTHWKFTGTSWKRRHKPEQQRYLENAYRVLLTRARQGMVIYIPHGDSTDPTRPTSFYEQTAQYLIDCGVGLLDEIAI